MRIGLISQWFPPEHSFLCGDLSTGLTQRGHDVRVLTTFPSYPQGRIYPGYRQRWRDDSLVEGVPVRRVPSYPSHDHSAFRRATSYLSFGSTSTLASLRYLAGRDVNYVYLPPPTSAMPAVLARSVHRVPFVLHVQDPWPESVMHSGMVPTGRVGAAGHRTIAGAMRWLYRAAGAIVVISPQMAEMVIERGADPATVSVLLNWGNERLFRPVPPTDAARSAVGHTGRCTVMFAGNMGPVQRIETAIRAAASVSDRVDLVLVGSGNEEGTARQLAAELGATNVRFLDRRPPEEMAELYAVADYQLICLRDAPELRGTVPSKLQAAFACGAPVVAATGGHAADLVEESGAGFTCPPEDWRALAERFRDAAELPPAARAALGARARQFYLRRMSLRTGLDCFEDILAKVADQGVSGRG